MGFNLKGYLFSGIPHVVYPEVKVTSAVWLLITVNLLEN